MRRVLASNVAAGRPRPAVSPIVSSSNRRATRSATTREVVVEGGSLTIGRATDNDLVALDGLVSRHHGRIVGRRGTLVYADLGSTNGSRVNGVPVTEVVLGVGDRLEVGDTAVIVEVARVSD